MKLLIDKDKLELLLEKKREFIGNKVALDTIIAGISFLLSVFTATYRKILGIPGKYIKGIFCVIGILYAIKIVWDVIQMYKNKYDHNVLLKEIEDLDMIQHKHSLVVIQNPYKSMEKYFLVYYDERWDCKLFLNLKTQENGNEAFIKEQVSSRLNIDKEKMKCKYITSRVQEKFSVSHNENRLYDHRLYEVKIPEFPEKEKEMDFEVNGIHYYWMTMEEMGKDSNIRKKNLEVLDFVKEVFEK